MPSVGAAIDVANDTSFGLGGIVFGGDEDAAFRMARRMDTGSVGVNMFASNHYAPFGGRHDSGLGVEYGLEGLAAREVNRGAGERVRGLPRSRPGRSARPHRSMRQRKEVSCETVVASKLDPGFSAPSLQ